MDNVSLPSKTWPTSPGQKRLWVIAEIDRDSVAAYNMPVILRLDGALDGDALDSAIQQLIRRHEALRTTFVETDGEPHQVVHAEPRLTLERIDLSGNANAEAIVGDLAARHAATPFDLATGPLLRATLVRLGDDRHRLFFNIHHIICDEWSLGVLVSDLSSLYASARRGEPATLPPLPLQYRDYAAWQNRLLERDEMQQHRQYWDQKLAGAVTAVDLPADRARPAKKSYAARVLTFQLEPRLVADLKKLAASRQTTLFAVLVALVKVLLFRYTSETDITVGCPVAGRDHPDLAPQVGFYVNTLALRDRLSPDDSFVDVLDRVKSTLTEALEHQAYPFDDLVSRLPLERDASRSPVFDVSINLTPSSLEAGGLQLAGVTVSSVDASYASAKVDLSFDFTETPDSLQLTLIYSSALYNEHRISRLGRHFEQLAAAVAAAPRRRIVSLRLLPESERRQLITFSGRDDDSSRDETIVDIFDAQAQRTPEQAALRFDTETVSYGELNRRANQLARALLSSGVGPGVSVGVFMDRSPGMITAFLAILKASGAYLPLDTTLPSARVGAMLNDSLAPIVITDAVSEDRLPSFFGTPLNLDSEWSDISRESADAPATKPEPGDTAYLIYTSGSTGIPKAVAVEHRGLSNVAAVQRRSFGVTPNDRVLQFAASCFDASVFEIAMALCSGATLCLARREDLMPGAPLIRFLYDEGITIMTLPPSALSVTPTADLPALRLVNVAGEVCTPDLPRAWGLARRFFNLYGPSEATIWSTEASYGDEQAPPSIGKPIANAKIYILGPALQPAPIGVPGEIYIGGVGVARGYLHRPTLTAERFVPDPFAATAGARLFRTGDIGRWQEDGAIEFLGRADHQVKIRGYRIELGEIEAVLAQHPRIRAAAVVYRADGNGSMHLRGYVIPSDERVDAQDLRTWLRATLPDYMVPTTITSLSTFPTTPGGKVDRAALPDPDAVAPDAGREMVAPRTPLESVIARVFADVLDRDRVGVTDSFFDIGGHSLLATRVVSRLREWFHIEVPLPRFFQESSVAALADAVKALEPDNAEKVARALERLWSMSPEEKQALRAKKAGFQRDTV